MKFYVGSYNKNIFEVTIDEKKGRFTDAVIYKQAIKPSYLIPYNGELAYINILDEKQYLTIGNKKLNLGKDTSCHLSYDKVNKLMYTSQYHAGSLNIINTKNGRLELLNTIKYEKNSHIHFAKWINQLELTGVCDLGSNKFHLYHVNNQILKHHTSFEFNEGDGPRHFIAHKRLPIIYVICEHSSLIYVLEYEENNLTLLQKVSLEKGDAAAIRMSNDHNFLYASDRLSNTISSFEILKDGCLILNQTIDTYGDHPRDFNISTDGSWLVVANMNSSTLSLYKVDQTSGSLLVTDKDFRIDQGAAVLFK